MLLQRRSPRRVVAGAAAVITISAVVLLPWTAYLAVTLPPSVTARHWSLAWTGLDIVMVAGLAMTGVLAIRRDRRVAFAAASTATVLLADAWFDVCTSAAGRPLALALADMGIEVGEAACCVLLAWAVWRDPLPRSDQSGTLSSCVHRYPWAAGGSSQRYRAWFTKELDHEFFSAGLAVPSAADVPAGPSSAHRRAAVGAAGRDAAGRVPHVRGRGGRGR